MPKRHFKRVYLRKFVIFWRMESDISEKLRKFIGK